MRLIKLEASDKRFKTVVFNRTGLSFILAKQVNPDETDRNRTYNGVGKSLLIALVHFCLGSSTKPSFEEKLNDWTFYLTVEIQNEEYIFARSTSEQKTIYVNGEKYTVKKFTDFLQEKCFRIPTDSQFLSFRSLLPFFIRPSRTSYVDCMKPGKTGSDYQTQLYNAFLIGLDTGLARKKKELKKEIDNIKQWKDNINKDQLLKDFLSSKKSASLTLREIEDKIQKLERDISAFEVAEDYDDVVKRGDSLKQRLDENRNQLFLLELQLRNIDENLAIDPDLNGESIIKLYNEAKNVLQESVIRKLKEVEQFYRTLNEKRTQRLLAQKSSILQSRNELNTQHRQIQAELDQCLKYLGDHRAIDAYSAIVREHKDLIMEKERITQYEKLIEDYSAKGLTCKQDILEVCKQTRQYLLGDKKNIESVRDYFRTMAKRFYPDSTAGVEVKSNDGENQICYDIDPRLDSDNSFGIGNVKILCYDTTLLFRGARHSIQFLFHDSCVLHGIDTIHVEEWFQTLYDTFPKNGDFQYIASINQNQIDSLKATLPPEDFKKIIDDHIILTLTDEGDNGKLLGFTVDLNYE